MNILVIPNVRTCMSNRRPESLQLLQVGILHLIFNFKMKGNLIQRGSNSQIAIFFNSSIQSNYFKNTFEKYFYNITPIFMILKYTLIDLHHNKYYPAHKYSPFLNLCMTLIDGQNNEEVNLYHEVISERERILIASFYERSLKYILKSFCFRNCSYQIHVMR